MSGGMTGGAIRTEDPVVSGHFYLTITGAVNIADLYFNQASGFGSESEVVEVKSAKKDDYHTIQQVPGRLKWQAVSLKGPMTSKAKELWGWRAKVEEGGVDSARCNASVVLLDQKGAPVCTWNFMRAYPKKLGMSQVDSGTANVLLVEVEIVHEKMEMA